MKSDEYAQLARKIHRCSACSFRNRRIEPLCPPLPTSPVSIMFVGENPSWAKGQGIPFAATTVSGQALDVHYLKPLGLTRDTGWITDLFKCRYPKPIYHAKAKYDKAIQKAASICAQRWLLEEIRLVQPKILITLSDKQVYQRLRRAFNLSVPLEFTNAVGKPHPVELDGQAITLFPMVHPDVGRPLGGGDDRKRSARAKWAHLHQSVHIPVLREMLSQGTYRTK